MLFAILTSMMGFASPFLSILFNGLSMPLRMMLGNVFYDILSPLL